MKIIYNKFIPFPGYMAMTILKWIFIREEYKKYEGTETFNKMLNHESIHYEQEKELAFIFFYIWYLIEWLLKLIPALISGKGAYESISFEQEAYNNEDNYEYINSRKKWNWIQYVLTLKN